MASTREMVVGHTRLSGHYRPRPRDAAGRYIRGDDWSLNGKVVRQRGRPLLDTAVERLDRLDAREIHRAMMTSPGGRLPIFRKWLQSIVLDGQSVIVTTRERPSQPTRVMMVEVRRGAFISATNPRTAWMFWCARCRTARAHLYCRHGWLECRVCGRFNYLRGWTKLAQERKTAARLMREELTRQWRARGQKALRAKRTSAKRSTAQQRRAREDRAEHRVAVLQGRAMPELERLFREHHERVPRRLPPLYPC